MLIFTDFFSNKNVRTKNSFNNKKFTYNTEVTLIAFRKNTSFFFNVIISKKLIS